MIYMWKYIPSVIIGLLIGVSAATTVATAVKIFRTTMPGEIVVGNKEALLKETGLTPDSPNDAAVIEGMTPLSPRLEDAPELAAPTSEPVFAPAAPAAPLPASAPIIPSREQEHEDDGDDD